MDQLNAPSPAEASPQECPRIRDWLWYPWYAKTWWMSIVGYWLPASGPLKISALEPFYTSNIGAYLNVIFLPMTAAVVLGFGYVRVLFDKGTEENGEILDPSRFYPRPVAPHPSVDPFEPQSGSLWIGNGDEAQWK